MAFNEDILIWYFWKDLKPSIQIQLDIQSWKLGFWDKVIEKAIDAKAKVLLQLFFDT